MRLFRSEDEVDAWSRASGEPRGQTVTLARVWGLAQEWYGDRMAPTFRGRTAAQARAIFARHGLSSDFWQG